jgi:hypothetical protein
MLTAIAPEVPVPGAGQRKVPLSFSRFLRHATLSTNAAGAAEIAICKPDYILKCCDPHDERPCLVLGADRNLLIYSSTQQENIMLAPFTTWPAVQNRDRSVKWSATSKSAEDRAVDVVREEAPAPDSETFLGAVLSLSGAAAVALLLPLFTVFLPLALAWRAVLEMTVWRGEARYARDWRSVR